MFVEEWEDDEVNNNVEILCGNNAANILPKYYEVFHEHTQSLEKKCMFVIDISSKYKNKRCSSFLEYFLNLNSVPFFPTIILNVY